MISATDVHKMTETSIKKTLYLHYSTASEQKMMDHIADHLCYMEAHEDKVFLSRPLIRAGATIGAGLAVLKTDDEAKARAVMDDEPLIKAGLRRYELKLWRIQEGSMSVAISGVHGSAVLG